MIPKRNELEEWSLVYGLYTKNVDLNQIYPKWLQNATSYREDPYVEGHICNFITALFLRMNYEFVDIK